jgi:hypothetical protein
MFERNGQFFIITIDKKKILYWDKNQGSIWGGPLQYLPKDTSAIIKINNSRNRIPTYFKDILNVTDEEEQEFKKAKDDNELKDIVLKDTKRHGCKLIDIKIE